MTAGVERFLAMRRRLGGAGLLVSGLASVMVSVVLASCADDGHVKVSVREDGYSPREVHATKGQPLTMVFERTTENPCGEVGVIPDHDIRRDLPLNEPVEITFTPTRTGRLAFMCGLNRMKGAIIVQ